MTALLAYQGVGKTFPGVVALDGVSFSVASGEVRALMGENGAGKSTLLKILAGEYRPDSGRLLVDGAPVAFTGPRDSQAAGIAIIHQELHLAPDLTVTENLLLGMMPSRAGFIDRKAARERATAILARLGEDIDPDARVRSLPIGKRQMIEIGKALVRDARIIAFDEPTSSLSARETRTLMRIIDDLRRDGRAILYVSHRMEEVFEISDSVTVLRDGRHVGDFPDMKALTQDQLITAMAGRTIADIYNYRPRPLGDVAVEVERLEGPGLREPINLSVTGRRDPRLLRVGRCGPVRAVPPALRGDPGRCRPRHHPRRSPAPRRSAPRDRGRPRALPGGSQGRRHRAARGGIGEYRDRPPQSGRWPVRRRSRGSGDSPSDSSI